MELQGKDLEDLTVFQKIGRENGCESKWQF